MSIELNIAGVTIMKKYSGSLKELTSGNNKEFLSLQVHYDNGKVSKELRYDKNSNLEEEHEFIYDENGKLIMHNWVMPQDEVEQSEKTERDEKGRVVREVKLYYGEEGESTSYEYDDKGRLIHISHRDEEGELVQQEKLEYTDSDKVTTASMFDPADGGGWACSKGISSSRTA